MLDLTTLTLQPDAAAEVVLPDGRVWHAQGGDPALWLSSPPLPLPTGDLSVQLGHLKDMLALHLRASHPRGLRLTLQGSGELTLQCAWSATQPCEAFWSDAWAAESAWTRALVDGEMPALPRLSASAESDIFVQVLAAVQQDAELQPLLSVNAEDKTLVFESPQESWIVGLICGPQVHQATLVLPLRVLSTEPEQALGELRKALGLNAGPTLGPDICLGLDATDPEFETLLVLARLDLNGLQPEDLKAAIGKLLRMGEDITQIWDEDPEVPQSMAGRAAPMFGHEDQFMNIRG